MKVNTSSRVVSYVKRVYGHLSIASQIAMYDLITEGRLGEINIAEGYEGEDFLVAVGANDQPDGVHNLVKYAHLKELFTTDYVWRLFQACRMSAMAFHPSTIRLLSFDQIRATNIIYKINAQDALEPTSRPALVGTVEEAVSLGARFIGYTLNENSQMEELTGICRKANEVGLPVATWCYPRGAHLVKTVNPVGTYGMDKKVDHAQALDVIMTSLRRGVLAGSAIFKSKIAENLLLDVKNAEFTLPKDLSSQELRLQYMKMMVGEKLLIISGGEPASDPAKKVDAEDKWITTQGNVAKVTNGWAVGRFFFTQEDIKTAEAFADRMFDHALTFRNQ